VFHRILVGVDDTSAARAALDRAIDLVEAGHARLGLLSSAPHPPPFPAIGPMVLPVTRRQLDEELVRWAQGNVEAAAALVPDDVPVTKLVTRGAPVGALLREARGGDWDLLVVGQSDRPHRWPLLSAGERLNRRSPTPVLVVHEAPTEAPRRQRSGLLGRVARRRRRRAQVEVA